MLSIPLCILYRQSLTERKQAAVRMESQPDLTNLQEGRHSPGNYRPVCLTAIVCKVMESLRTTYAIMNHMDSNRFLSDNQLGFIPG